MPAASRSSSGGSGPQPGSRLTSERLEESGKWLRIAIYKGQAQPIGAEQLLQPCTSSAVTASIFSITSSGVLISP